MKKKNRRKLSFTNPEYKRGVLYSTNYYYLLIICIIIIIIGVVFVALVE